MASKKVQVEQILAHKSNTVVRSVKGKDEDIISQEIEYSSVTFNPFL